MADVKQTFDVFISHGVADAKLAAEVGAALRASGLRAVAYSDLLSGGNIGEAVWDALAESQALVVLLSPSGPTPSMGIELGAARTWNKPIFAVATDPAIQRIPAGLGGIPFYTPGRIDDVISAINSSRKELSDEDRDHLGNAYAEIGVSVDDLALNPSQLAELVSQFREATGKAISGERLLSELLRMRKQGKLARIERNGKSRPRKGTA